VGKKWGKGWKGIGEGEEWEERERKGRKGRKERSGDGKEEKGIGGKGQTVRAKILAI